MGSISGEFYRNISNNGSFGHWSFYPNRLSSIVHELRMDVELTHLLVQAHRTLGVLEGLIRSIPNIEPVLHMLMLSEAKKSCAVDGIYTDAEGLFVCSKRKKEDLLAVNYCEALCCLRKGPVTIKGICDVQAALLKNLSDQPGGEIRKTIFLMHPQYVSNRAEFNPPPPNQVPDLMRDLEKFIQEENTMDILVKAAAVYYQFETIHPFESSNGLAGRILILLLLMQEGILSRLALLVSDFLLKDKDESLRCFINIQHFGYFSEWIRFFIKGITASAEHTIHMIEAARQQRKMDTAKINSCGKMAEPLLQLYNFIEKNPIVSVDDVSGSLGTAYNTAAKRLGMLCELKIVKKNDGRSRYRLFTFDGLLRIFELEE